MTADVARFKKWLEDWLHKKIEKKINTTLIGVDDFKKVMRLAKKLQKHQDPISQLIYNSFIDNDRVMLNGYISEPSNYPKFPKRLSEVLNSLLEGNPLYNEHWFKRENLSEDTIKLLDAKPSEKKDLVRLNRLLLEDAYPSEIKSSHVHRWIALALPILLSLAVAGIFSSTLMVYEHYTRKPIEPIDPSQYGFDDNTNTLGWVTSQDSERGFALSNEGISKSVHVKGNASMSVQVVLEGSERGRKANKHKGEVYVDPTLNKPAKEADISKSLDLSNKILKASVIFPKELVGKIPSEPTFAQLFIEACERGGRFNSDVYPITSPGQLNLVLKTDSKMNNICRIGIKIGLNSEPGYKDNNKYEGKIYVDCVDW